MNVNMHLQNISVQTSGTVATKLPAKFSFALQVATAHSAKLPPRAQVREWVRAALLHVDGYGEVTVRVVDEDEMADLNFRYRGRKGATDVLAFPFAAEELPAEARDEILGDVVLCAPLAISQAQKLRRAHRDHCAHLIVHGVLHLCGFDHDNPASAARMQQLEREILSGVGIMLPHENGDGDINGDSNGGGDRDGDINSDRDRDGNRHRHHETNARKKS